MSCPPLRAALATCEANLLEFAPSKFSFLKQVLQYGMNEITRLKAVGCVTIKQNASDA
jgi:hypothetical protein